MTEWHLQDRNWQPPTAFEEYKLIRLLGKGAMGQVFLGRDEILDREVAIKFISAPLASSPISQQRFLTEARAAARVQHPNVASVYRVGHISGHAYIVSELVRGRSLDQIKKPMAWREALEIAIDLAQGLAAAHRKGVLHRDLKPANAILADSGEAKLLDFGLAKIAGDSLGAKEQATSEVSTSSDTVRVPGSQEATETIPVSVRSLLGVEHLGAPSADGKSPAVTGPGAMLGTPLYMSPESWRCEPETGRTDIYSLGVLLYELCSGSVLFPEEKNIATLGLLVIERDPRPLATIVSGIDEQLAAIVDRCIRRDPSERFATANELCDALDRVVSRGSMATAPTGNPYQGLRAFEAEHSALFFGRDTETREIIERLRQEPFILVTGDSGVGKSSLCRAAVIPRVVAGALRNRRDWSTFTIVPGRWPLEALADPLSRVLDVSASELRRQLGKDPDEVARNVGRQMGQDAGLIVFIDQLEELATVSDPSEALQAGAFLGALALGAPSVRLLGSARADFLTRLAALPVFGPELTRALYLVPPMTRDGIARAIVGPAEIKGYRYESAAMIDRLVESAANAENLPLLQFALAELWENRDEPRRTIPAEALDRIGGVGGALARHADGILARLLPSQRAAAERILTSLVTSQRTRIRRAEDELFLGDPDVRAALDALVRGRLLVAREAQSGSAFEVAHEALISGWGTLRTWIERASESRAALERLEASATEWERLDKPTDALWRQRQVAEISRFGSLAMGARERSFLDASRRAAKRRRRRLRTLIAAVPIAIGLSIVGVRFHATFDTRTKVEAQLDAARGPLGDARTGSKAADLLRAQALALFDEGKVEEAEKVWTELRGTQSRVEALLGRANDSIARGLAIDTKRSDVRARYGDLLLERAFLAERSRSFDRLAEILRQLPLYDDSGERQRAWSAPGRLVVETSPPGASVVLERYETDERGHRNLVDARSIGTTPLRDVTLAPGSYRLTVAEPSRVTVRYPFLLGRGEELRASIPMSPEAGFPRNFSYVPAGRFLLGSGGDDQIRAQFFNAVPLHTRTTGAYLIANHEVTFAEWLEFLAELPSGELAQRTPHAEGTWGFVKLIKLDKLDKLAGGEWELQMQPANHLYRARAGEPIVYLARDRRVRQDWLRFPVAGISFLDAKAYAAWLAGTGRVPGARLCNELEWERAARGADDRDYPHGMALDPDDAVFDRTYGKQLLATGPDEVSSHPASRSPFGLDDMAGNVWEWTTLSTADSPVLRGGSFSYNETVVCSLNRELPDPIMRGLYIGLRVCADVPRNEQTPPPYLHR